MTEKRKFPGRRRMTQVWKTADGPPATRRIHRDRRAAIIDTDRGHKKVGGDMTTPEEKLLAANSVVLSRMTDKELHDGSRGLVMKATSEVAELSAPLEVKTQLVTLMTGIMAGLTEIAARRNRPTWNPHEVVNDYYDGEVVISHRLLVLRVGLGGMRIFSCGHATDSWKDGRRLHDVVVGGDGNLHLTRNRTLRRFTMEDLEHLRDFGRLHPTNMETTFYTLSGA